MTGPLHDLEPFIFVTVGTDHHPFTRLVHYLDTWLVAKGSSAPPCFIQFGTSTAPSQAEGRPHLCYEDMVSFLERATVFVCHGGPATIMEGRSIGLKPIVVPRQHRLAEHVDDHQVLFARRLARSGDIHLAETESSFRHQLDQALREPGTAKMPAAGGTLDATLARFSSLVTEMMSQPRRRHHRRVVVP